MYDVFGTAADERSSAATECELARKQVFSSPLRHNSLVQQFERSTFVLCRPMESACRAAEASNYWILIST